MHRQSANYSLFHASLVIFAMHIAYSKLLTNQIGLY